MGFQNAFSLILRKRLDSDKYLVGVQWGGEGGGVASCWIVVYRRREDEKENKESKKPTVEETRTNRKTLRNTGEYFVMAKTKQKQKQTGQSPICHFSCTSQLYMQRFRVV